MGRGGGCLTCREGVFNVRGGASLLICACMCVCVCTVCMCVCDCVCVYDYVSIYIVYI